MYVNLFYYRNWEIHERLVVRKFYQFLLEITNVVHIVSIEVWGFIIYHMFKQIVGLYNIISLSKLLFCITFTSFISSKSSQCSPTVNQNSSKGMKKIIHVWFTWFYANNLPINRSQKCWTRGAKYTLWGHCTKLWQCSWWLHNNYSEKKREKKLEWNRRKLQNINISQYSTLENILNIFIYFVNEVQDTKAYEDITSILW